MKEMMRSLRELVSDSETLVEAAACGNLQVRADISKHNGSYREIIEGLNRTLDAIVTPLNVGLAQLDKMSRGELSDMIDNTYQGVYHDFINDLNRLRNSLYDMLEQTDKITTEAKNGNLSYRADSSSLNGSFATIVDGINETLDATTNPIEEASSVLGEVAKGNLQVKVTGEYVGEHARIKNAVNETVESLSSYVSEIAYVLTEMAGGNLNMEIRNDYKGDFSAIKDSLNNIVRSLNDVLGDINEASTQVASGASQISDSAQALSQGSTEQASSVEELTASVDEIAAQTTKNAENAEKANKLALTAKSDAVKGNERMQDMLGAMGKINESSASINKIIKVIDDIAFQTNILALNAAVEAARAGQHGKGFAVVAEEVRNLAARSAKAAQETAELIEGSLQTIEDGTKITNKTATALGQIVEAVSEAAEIVGEIAVASSNQAFGIAQVNAGITQVSTVVQQNSATSEESAAASEELSSQAEMLKEMIGRFKLKSGSNSPYSGADQSHTPTTEDSSHSGTPTRQIILSDSEFGKY
ncbi:MAG: methyl-accepting chemotaxis protein [Oscillospiraceae bacterium]|jgi:methyl-accepting chemotaxis protein|nr:methyl-accepting chemotaxis protein [Oscillospiraceae bacterium]